MGYDPYLCLLYSESSLVSALSLFFVVLIQTPVAMVLSRIFLTILVAFNNVRSAEVEKPSAKVMFAPRIN
jgi:hypothetical protein